MAAFLTVVVALATLSVPGAVGQEGDTRRPPTPVEVLTVTKQSRIALDEDFAGLVAARRESQLGFETGGLLAAVRVDVGDVVAEGDVLAALDLRTLDAQIAAAEASVREARASRVLADLTSERQDALTERGFAATQRLDEAQANAAVAAARVAAATASLEQLTVRRELAELKAPFAGTITQRFLDEGAIAAPGAPIVHLVEASAREFRVGLPRSEAEGLIVGDAYELVSEGRTAQARLRAVTGVVERNSQTVTAVFDLPESAPSAFAAGSVARLSLPVQVEAEGFWLPISALAQGRRGLWTVLALSPDRDEGEGVVLEARTVDVLFTDDERVYVRGTLRDGDQVVAGGLDGVVPGQRVTPSASVAAR